MLIQCLLNMTYLLLYNNKFYHYDNNYIIMIKKGNFLGIDIGSDLNFVGTTKLLKTYKINYLQIYSPKYSDETFSNILKHNFKIFIHSSYTNNIASNWSTTSSSINNIINDIHYANKIGAIGVVIHLGKQLDLSCDDAMENIVSSIVYIHNKTSLLNIEIILETSAGQGSEMCYNLYDLSTLYKKIKKSIELPKRIKICIDTCHIFVAGYDITSKNKIIKFIKIFDKLIGLNNVSLVHLNDSKNVCGSHIDRHENIGKGYIGKKNLKIIFKFFRNRKIPCILETNKLFYENDFHILNNVK